MTRPPYTNSCKETSCSYSDIVTCHCHQFIIGQLDCLYLKRGSQLLAMTALHFKFSVMKKKGEDMSSQNKDMS